ncbi:fused MFS/spermidine synthase [Spirosoma sp. BT702]|uniref:Fused MFS/spermidine synthase n=1 Tax=Spirosoma profusum TaxID=2771354 RepID=A0A926Y0T3_9BACT|nr:fused MFS/spermidine synthase [Spirosoma profusum]MBD2704377.1 fused MFS/spermidine synthase [Spirosoma profusum]
MPISTSRQPLVVLLLFFLSGFAALLYQVIWQRLLVFYTGSDTVSISLIVSAFMTGLGIGYLAGGRLADRSTSTQNLRYFVLAELGIMVFALFSKAILYDFLYQSNQLPTDKPLLVYVIVFGIVLLPTFLMGVSLPVLSRTFRFGDMAQQARYISLLYFINTLGAAVGAFVTGFLLVRRLGFDNAIFIGAALNGLCAVCAWDIGRGATREKALGDGGGSETLASSHAPDALSPSPHAPHTLPLTTWSVQYAVSGFAALSLELIWFRVLETLIKSVSLTFAILLAIYLGSMAVGTVAGTWLTSRSVYQSVVRRERAFLLAQLVLYGYTALSVGVFVNAIGRVPGLQFLWDYFASGEPVLSPRFSLFTYGAVPIFLLGIPTFLMGLSFSLSQSLIQDNYAQIGRRVGWLQFINIVGSAVGAWAVTWVGFAYLGTSLLLKYIVALSFGYVVLLLLRRHISASVAGGLAVALGLFIWIIPDNAQFWQRLNGLEKTSDFVFDENESAVSVIKMTPDQKMGIVFVNGLGQSGLPYHYDAVHTLLGALPVMMHPDPKHVAVIGLGSAGTVNGIAGRLETRRIDCFEIASNQEKVLADYAGRVGDTAVNAVLRDRRLKMIFRDGRYAIRNGAARYDVIEADALRPLSAYSGNVYSREYFELVRDRLRPGGLAVTWCPTGRVFNTFRAVFPYVAYCDKLVLIGSNQPIQLDWKAIEQRAKADFSRRHYNRSGIDIWSLLDHYRPHIRLLPRATGVQGEINTDLFPKDEYSIRVKDRIDF